MAQNTTGIRRVLGNPRLFDLTQNLFGAARIRREFVQSALRAKSGERILDVGSGTGDMLAYLPDGVEYVGIEPNARYCHAARERFGARARFICGFYEEPLAASLGRFDKVILCGVLHHLDDEPAKRLFAILASRLEPGGAVASIDPVFDPDQSGVARFLISMDRGGNVRRDTGYRALAASSFRVVDGEVRHRPMPPYTHFVMSCREPLPEGPVT